jgi:hypothetical protein
LHGQLSICHDDPVTTPLHRATAAHKRALAAAEERRKELVTAIREADADGMKQVEIVKITGYTREHIRRIVAGGHAAS